SRVGGSRALRLGEPERDIHPNGGALRSHRGDGAAPQELHCQLTTSVVRLPVASRAPRPLSLGANLKGIGLMLHGYMYQGAFERNHESLRPGATTYRARSGAVVVIPEWPRDVNGLRVGYMERRGKRFYAVRV